LDTHAYDIGAVGRGFAKGLPFRVVELGSAVNEQLFWISSEALLVGIQNRLDQVFGRLSIGAQS